MRWSDGLLLLSVLAHVFGAPFSKVEESFNLQATHDVLFHTLNVTAYDHLEFPGVVPRTFTGALLLGAASAPAVAVASYLQAPKLAALVIVRCFLGAAVTASFSQLRIALSSKLGALVGDSFMLLTALQFHLPFYASRTLPNTFALALTNVACAAWVSSRPKRAVVLLVFTAAVLRCEVVLLLAPVALHLLASRQLSILGAIATGLGAFLASLAITVPIDSLLWRRRLWPEGEVFLFNAVRGKSTEWGVSPWHWYLTSALPRALLGGLPLSLWGIVLERRLRPITFAAAFYVATYSALAHKEVRFLFPALPLFNALAAAALAWCIQRARKSTLWSLVLLGCIGLLLATLVAKLVMSWAAFYNYPGGWAMMQLPGAGCAPDRGGVNRVHVDVLPAMTGVSRFGELGGGLWTFSKEERLTDAELAGRGFTHLLSARDSVKGFTQRVAVSGFSRIRLNKGLPPLRIEHQPQVWIHCSAPRE